MLAYDTLGVLPFSSMSLVDPVNPLTVFERLRYDFASDRVYLVELTTTAGDKVRISTGNFRMPEQYYPYINQPLNYTSSLFASKTLTGRSANASGVINVLNGAGDLDSLLHIDWDNAPVTIKVGTPTAWYNFFEPIFTGKAESITWDEKSLQIRMRDRQSLFSQSIQQNKYAGTGGLEGSINLEGKPKPLAYGFVENVEPVLVDASNLIYQVHDGSINNISAVYFSGLAATEGIDYTVNKTNGTFTLLTAPLGVVTADVKGCDSGGYVESTIDIIKRLLTVNAGMTDSDFELKSFKIASSFNSSPIGYYLNDETTVQQVLDDLMTGIGGFWDFGFNDLIKLGIIVEPGRPNRTYTDTRIKTLKRIATPSAVWRTTAAFSRNWRVMSEAEIAGGVSDVRREFLRQPVRLHEVENATVKTARPLARVNDVRSYFQNEADAIAEATRLQTLHEVQRNLYEVVLNGCTFEEKLGERVAMWHARFAPGAGTKYTIVGISPNLGRNSIKLVLWG